MAQDRVVASPPLLKPITAQDFAIAQMQATVFTPDEEVSGAKLLKGFVPRWVKFFDADPFSLPVGIAVPREVARVVLHQKSGEWRCEISSERINIFWQKARTDSARPKSFTSDAATIISEYVAYLGARVGRMAAVVTRYAHHPKPGLFLARHFCQKRWADAPLNRPENFELHAHKTFILAGRFRVNSWVRNKTGVEGTPKGHAPIVVVEQDLNTLVEEMASNSFSASDISGFLEAARHEFEVILNLYYPSERDRL